MIRFTLDFVVFFIKIYAAMFCLSGALGCLVVLCEALDRLVLGI